MKPFMSWRLLPTSLALVGWLCLLPAIKAKTELDPGSVANIRVSEDATRTATDSPGDEIESPSPQAVQNSPGGQAGNPSVAHPPARYESRPATRDLSIRPERLDRGIGAAAGSASLPSIRLDDSDRLSVEEKLKQNREQRLVLERLLEENRQERLALLRMRAAQQESQPAAAGSSASSTGSKATAKGLTSAKPSSSTTEKKAGTPTPSATDTSKGSSPPDNKK